MSSETRSSASATSVTSRGDSPFVGSSISSSAIVVQERAADREHLLLPARERSRRLLAPRPQLGKQVVDEVVARLGIPLGEAQVLVDGERREHVAVLGDVPDAAAHDPVRAQALDVLAGELDRAAALDEAHQGPQGRGLADAVASEQRGDAAFGDVERDPLQHVGLTEVDVQIVDGDERRH